MKKKRILFVCDDNSLINVLRKILEGEGYLVERSSTCEEALKKIRDSKFDLLISDILHPNIRGEHVVKKIREKNSELRIILVLSYPSYIECIDMFKLGISDILFKPIIPDVLIKSIEDALEKPIFRHSNPEVWLKSREWI